MIMADYVCAMQDDNDTMAALRRYFTGQSMQTAIAAMPFRSAKKYGGVSFHEDETYLLGAPEILLAACPEKGPVFAAGRGMVGQGLPRAAAGPVRRAAGRRGAHGGDDAARAHPAVQQDPARSAADLRVFRPAGRAHQGHLRRQSPDRLRGRPPRGHPRRGKVRRRAHAQNGCGACKGGGGNDRLRPRHAGSEEKSLSRP